MEPLNSNYNPYENHGNIAEETKSTTSSSATETHSYKLQNIALGIGIAATSPTVRNCAIAAINAAVTVAVAHPVVTALTSVAALSYGAYMASEEKTISTTHNEVRPQPVEIEKEVVITRQTEPLI